MREDLQLIEIYKERYKFRARLQARKLRSEAKINTDSKPKIGMERRLPTEWGDEDQGNGQRYESAMVMREVS